MRYDFWFILIAIVFLLMGEGLGIWMAMHADFALAPMHAHVNLIGWATLALYGLIHHNFPALAKSPVAKMQFAVAVLAVPVMAAGLFFMLTGDADIAGPAENLAISGALLVVLGTLMFLAMFWMEARKKA